MLRHVAQFRPTGRHRRPVVAPAVLMLVAAASACSSGGSTAQPPAKPIVYVAVGASETVGYGADNPSTEAWPRVLLRTALPPSTVFDDLGIAGATVKDALAQEVPAAVAKKPDLVTVWLNVNDMLSFIKPATYQQQLDDLVKQLRRGGATKVLVANVPPLDRLPSFLACKPNPPAGAPPCPSPALAFVPIQAVVTLVDNFNTAIATVVRQEGAVLVDLHAAGLAARAAGTEGSLIGKDGFHPSTAGHKAVAAAFAQALSASGGP